MPWTPDETGMDDDVAGADEWLCQAGHIHQAFHCPHTGEEPPWGCPCSFCQEGEDEEDEAFWEPDEDVP